MGLCLVERGGALMHKHFHMVVKGNSSSLLVLHKKFKICWVGMRILQRVILFHARN